MTKNEQEKQTAAKENKQPEPTQAQERAPESPGREDEYKDLLQRERADFENYKKRVEREVRDAKEIARIRVLQKLLPLADSFDHALAAITAHSAAENDAAALKKNNDEMRRGFELLCAQLHNTLKQEGVEPIHSLGRASNPYEHEVLLQTPGEEPEGTILEELQKGYKLGNAVLRHAKVRVSAGKTEVNTDAAEHQ